MERCQNTTYDHSCFNKPSTHHTQDTDNTSWCNSVFLIHHVGITAWECSRQDHREITVFQFFITICTSRIYLSSFTARPAKTKRQQVRKYKTSQQQRQRHSISASDILEPFSLVNIPLNASWVHTNEHIWESLVQRELPQTSDKSVRPASAVQLPLKTIASHIQVDLNPSTRRLWRLNIYCKNDLSNYLKATVCTQLDK